jgi:hypothetical protein
MALPEDMRDAVLSNNFHLDAAVRRRDLRDEWDVVPKGERNEVRAGWIALDHMMRQGLPLGPVAAVQARYVSRSKVHHRDCYLVRSPVVETSPLGDIAHRSYCSQCDGPGFDLSDDHLDYLWAVLAVDDLADSVNDHGRRSRGGSANSDSLESWGQRRRDEIYRLGQAISIAETLASAEPRIEPLTKDVSARVRYRIAGIEAELAAGPNPDGIPPDDIAVRGENAIRSWRISNLRKSSARITSITVPDILTVGRAGSLSSGATSRLIDTPRTRAKVRSPSYVTGITHQRVEVANTISSVGKARCDPDLVHPVWGASYEWMAAKLTEKHPPSAGRAIIWGIVTSTIAHQACDSSCGDGLPSCDLFHPYPGHASIHVQIPEKRVLLSDWQGWDHIVFGGYIPINEDDSRAFGQALVDRFGSEVPSPVDWPHELVRKAKESWIRCLRITNGPLDTPVAGTQFVVSELRANDVIDVVKGPPLDDAERWWDYHVAKNPGEADRRERSTASLEDLRQRHVTACRKRPASL